VCFIADTCDVLKAQARTFGHKKGRAKMTLPSKINDWKMLIF